MSGKLCETIAEDTVASRLHGQLHQCYYTQQQLSKSYAECIISTSCDVTAQLVAFAVGKLDIKS